MRTVGFFFKLFGSYEIVSIFAVLYKTKQMKIIFAEPIGIDPVNLDKFRKCCERQGHEVIYYNETEEEALKMEARMLPADILVVEKHPVTACILTKCKNLKMISVAFTGYDHIDIEACNVRNIAVSNAPGYSTYAAAELTIGMMISVLRNFTWGDTQVRMLGSRENFLGRELFEKTVGIIGMGAIGSRVAELLKAFGCNILAYSRSSKDIEGVNFVSLATLLKESDIVSVHLPLNDSTRHLFADKELAMMGKESVLINTVGDVVSSEALAKALKEGTIAAAAVDIYEHEPPLPGDHPLLDAPNLLLLPHIGYATHNSVKRRGEIVCQNILAWLADKPCNRIN